MADFLTLPQGSSSLLDAPETREQLDTIFSAFQVPSYYLTGVVPIEDILRLLGLAHALSQREIGFARFFVGDAPWGEVLDPVQMAIADAITVFGLHMILAHLGEIRGVHADTQEIYDHMVVHGFGGWCASSRRGERRYRRRLVHNGKQRSLPLSRELSVVVKVTKVVFGLCCTSRDVNIRSLPLRYIELNNVGRYSARNEMASLIVERTPTLDPEEDRMAVFRDILSRGWGDVAGLYARRYPEDLVLQEYVAAHTTDKRSKS